MHAGRQPQYDPVTLQCKEEPKEEELKEEFKEEPKEEPKQEPTEVQPSKHSWENTPFADWTSEERHASIKAAMQRAEACDACSWCQSVAAGQVKGCKQCLLQWEPFYATHPARLR